MEFMEYRDVFIKDMIFYEEEFWDKIYKEKTAAWGYEPAECLKKWIKEFIGNGQLSCNEIENYLPI